ncbi:DUF2927 domain-containing protein [Ruegeria faecimaris]|uniref:DUF2927 domain-containing protein n=1 Tax=Ruegeria faecimaris TaxID=686389 RepID=A0A521D202_9RHOB|nr:DUF2927 domain-containing protein [Ruegeria faecimaris]SMO65704.1 Protein of unknown function [Ruegeria faecimaris]
MTTPEQLFRADGGLKVRSQGYLKPVLGLVALLALANCDEALTSSVAPQPRPVAPPAPALNAYVPPSAASQDLARFYQRVERDLLTRGMLRSDGGGPDTPYDASDLERNFETIAFFNEYPDHAVTATTYSTEGQLSRWSAPIRVQTEFAPSVSPEMRAKDAEQVETFTARLSKVTGHPMSVVTRKANFHVFFAGKDDGAYVVSRLKQLVPGIDQPLLDLVANPRSNIDCFVIASPTNRSLHRFVRAVVLIRAELPDMLRRSCIHEEMAQGLGLSNDSNAARPSIFNDDDEFALLTSHDEKLLTMLYDPRLEPGVAVEDARPVVRIIARELMGQQL